IFCLLTSLVAIVIYFIPPMLPECFEHFYENRLLTGKPGQRLFTCCFTSFTTNHLTNVLHTFSFVWFRLTEAAQFCSYLADQLFIDTLKVDLRVIPFFLPCSYFKFFWNL